MLTSNTVLGETETDISTFLKAKFTDIRQRHGLEASWPPSNVLSRIANCRGRLIYPFAMVHCLEHARRPQNLLDQALSNIPKDVGSEEKELDALYSVALRSEGNSVSFIWSLHLIQAGYFGDRVQEHLTAAFLSQFLGRSTDLKGLSADMAGLVEIPRDSSYPVSVYHRSILEFLNDQRRCGTLYISETSRFKLIAMRYMESCQSKWFFRRLFACNRLIELCTKAPARGQRVGIPFCERCSPSTHPFIC